MANSGPSTNDNARQPNIIQGGSGVQLVPAPQGVYFQEVQPAPPGVNPGYRASAGRWTGGIQLVCGVAAVILGITNIVFDITWLAVIGIGIWTGLAFYITAGILGIVSANKSRCVIIAYMVMSILSSVMAGGTLVICSFQTIFYLHRSGTALLIIALLTIVALVELVTSITAAAFCCAGTACCSSPTDGNYVQQPLCVVPDQTPLWQPPMATRPPMAQHTQHGPTGGGAMAQAQAGGEKHPPYN